MLPPEYKGLTEYKNKNVRKRVNKIQQIKNKIHTLSKKTVSLITIQAIIVSMMALSGCGLFSKDSKETQNIQLENNVSTDIIIVERVEELGDTENSNVSELPEKDLAKAKEDLVPDGLKYYAYDHLNDEEKLLYTEIYGILDNCASDTKVSSKDPDQIEKAFNYVMLDHPEIFYITGYSFTKYMRGQNIEKITLSGTYTMNKTDVERSRLAVEAYIDKCISEYPGSADEYEKVKYVYEYLIKNTEYDLTAPNNQNVLSVVEEKKTVCQGYAKAMQLILNRMGVFCILCEGVVKGTESHVWDIVRINGSFYHVDTTWGDASYRIEDNAEGFEAPEINHDYLCVTDDAIKETHVIKDNIELPVCDSMEDNYYVREGLYLTEVDTDIISSAFDKAIDRGEKIVTLKSANANVYTAVFNHLIDNHKIFDYLHGSTSVNYVEFKDECRISFYLK